MDLQTHQYQMWLAVKKHQDLVGRRQRDPDNLALQREILEVLCQLVAINESQKSVVSRLRREREIYRSQLDRSNYNDNCNDAQESHKDGVEACHSPPASRSPGEDTGPNAGSPPFLEMAREEGHSEDYFEYPEADGPGAGSGPGSPTSWCSPEKRLRNFQPPTADYTIEDVHDLVTEEEFMHALGLLTVRECKEVMEKRYERRKRNAYSHIFSATIWEKPETRRKRRAWLMSGAGSPPTLRRKVRPPSQPPSQPQSRPTSPAQSSCSPPTTCPPSQAASPQSVEEEFPPQPSEEVCPMCKMKGADVQCDGCGVTYHGPCVDLGHSEPPPCWLCLTCEQRGMRASSTTAADPHYHSRRREALEIRERLLRQRAELTISKLQLEERKQQLAVALQAQCSERDRLQQKEEEVREAIHRLQNFIFTFQQNRSRANSPVAVSQAASPAMTTRPVTITPHPRMTRSNTSSPGVTPRNEATSGVRSPSPYHLELSQGASSPNSPSNTLKWSETSSTPSPSPSDITPQLLLPGLTITRTSSPGQSSSQSSSQNHNSSKNVMPSLTISRTSPPLFKPGFLSSVTISQSGPRSQTSHPSFASRHKGYSSSPTPGSKGTSPTPTSYYPSLRVSPASSPRPSISISPIYSTETSQRKDTKQSRQGLKPSGGGIHAKKRAEVRNRAPLTHQNEHNVTSQPTDLSVASRKNCIPGIRRGENEAMAASL